jgi:hypothetical protein
LADEGLAQRLVPFKPKSNKGFFADGPLMRKQLFNINPGFSTGYKPGFKFRGLNDSTIFFDENHQHLTMNYRDAFINLAAYYLYQDRNNPMVINTLNEMEKIIPDRIFKMPENLAIDIAGFYLSAGDTSKYRSITAGVEASALNRLKNNPFDVDGNRLLIELYTNTKQYNKVIDVLTKLQQTYPDDPSIKSGLQRYKALAAQEDSNNSKRK